ncbi:MAG: sterol desaturase family protein [Deltaproteobacteria bacterium]
MLPVHSIRLTDDTPEVDARKLASSLGAQFAFFARQPSPRLLIALFAVAIGVRVAHAAWRPADALLAFAVFAYWPFQEWFLHRYLLHLKPQRIFGRTFDPQFARAHRAHHRRPWIVETTFLPTRVVLGLIPVTLFGWWLATPDIGLAATGVAASAAAATLYEWTHYLTHSTYVPRTAYVRRIFRNHRLHHFKNERHWFAFTVPLIDRALRTDPDPNAVDKSETVRTLGVDE